MFWFLGILFFGFCAFLMLMPKEILGGIILFCLCVWGIASGPFWVVIPSVLLLIGLIMNIFGAING